MITPDPELEAEQAHVDLAYRRLDETRSEAIRLRSMVEVGKGGTNQARWEREVIYSNIAERLRQLDIGERSLCFGRIDQTSAAGGGSYHIGRLAVSSDQQEPLIVDWRAPIAESFYRASSRDPMGLARRRYFTSRGRTVVALEDDLFGFGSGQPVVVAGQELRGGGALVAALEEGRSGKLGDVLGTIQAEQDEIIRAEMPGVLVVQGGPGTGKTVVALHRAAYLLYTYRFPLEGQGLMVVGPNRVFLNYIEQVLPSLGESGADVMVLADMAGGVRVTGRDGPASARLKGDLLMAKVVAKAVQDRQRPLREDLVVGFGARRLRLSAASSAHIVKQAKRRYQSHNAARSFVETEVYAALAASHPDGADTNAVRDHLQDTFEVRSALMWMWPLLTPAQLLYDLYGSKSLLASAGRSLTSDERRELFRPRRKDNRVRRVVWTQDDVPVLDEARERLGPKPKAKSANQGDVEPGWVQASAGDETVRTYGHIVVDEAQDLSPMQLRMLCRRSLNGSMTLVGDIAQSTGAWAHHSWQEILDHLPDRRPPRMAELTIGYRTPAPIMDLASQLLVEAAPDLTPPVSVRTSGQSPAKIRVGEVGKLVDGVVKVAQDEVVAAGVGNVAVICAEASTQRLINGLVAAGVPFGRGDREGLAQQLTLMPIHLVKGLEVDTAIVVEPAQIAAEQTQWARALYVACTRATKRLVIVHAEPLPTLLED